MLSGMTDQNDRLSLGHHDALASILTVGLS